MKKYIIILILLSACAKQVTCISYVGSSYKGKMYHAGHKH